MTDAGGIVNDPSCVESERVKEKSRLTGEEDAASGTGEAVLLLGIADVVYAANGQVEDGDLDEA